MNINSRVTIFGFINVLLCILYYNNVTICFKSPTSH